MTPPRDERYMRLALELAARAEGRTSPNPCVGAVIVKDDEIVGSGFHQRAGTPHAEVHALAAAQEKARGATLYVTLEPCSHTGRTPPCSHAVVRAGLARVVIGMLDPNPLVAGGGRTHLLEHGIAVETGVLEEECRRLNEGFIKHIVTGMPLVVLKAGVSLDGRLNYRKGHSGWITGAESGRRVHMLRNRYDAIMVGTNTAVIDDPSLTTRLGEGEPGRDPLRVVLDSRLSLPADAKMFTQPSEAQTWIFCGPQAPQERRVLLSECGVRIFEVAVDPKGRLDLRKVCRVLGDQGITSVLVEGGGTVFSALLAERLADRACLFYAPLFAGGGGCSLLPDLGVEERSGAIRLAETEYTRIGDDLLVEGRIVYPSA